MLLSTTSSSPCLLPPLLVAEAMSAATEDHDESLQFFRHVCKEMVSHEKYHADNPGHADFTAVPKECLTNINLLKTSLPTLYTSWLDKYNHVEPTKNVLLCCNLLRVVLEKKNKCPYTSTYVIGQSTAHHPLQSSCRILANPMLETCHDQVIELLSRMIQILTEATTATLDVVVSDIVTVLMNELEARRHQTISRTTSNHNTLDHTVTPVPTTATTPTMIRTVECFQGLNLSSPTSTAATTGVQIDVTSHASSMVLSVAFTRLLHVLFEEHSVHLGTSSALSRVWAALEGHLTDPSGTQHSSNALRVITLETMHTLLRRTHMNVLTEPNFYGVPYSLFQCLRMSSTNVPVPPLSTR